MILPTLDIISKGPKEVQHWCERRFASSEHTKKRYIVMNIQNLLHQVHMFQINDIDSGKISHESIFRSNVDYCFEKYYQFPAQALWDIFLPKLKILWSKKEDSVRKGCIRELPYERYEVENALAEFQDAAGSIMHIKRKAFFLHCSCVETMERKVACTNVKGGWKCARPVILIRMNMCLEREMTEKNRKILEMKNITDAEITARNNATNFLKTDLGKMIIRKNARKSCLEPDISDCNHSLNIGKINEIKMQKKSSESRLQIKRSRSKIINEFYAKINPDNKTTMKQKEDFFKQEYIENKCEKMRSGELD